MYVTPSVNNGAAPAPCKSCAKKKNQTFHVRFSEPSPPFNGSAVEHVCEISEKKRSEHDATGWKTKKMPGEICCRNCKLIRNGGIDSPLVSSERFDESDSNEQFQFFSFIFLIYDWQFDSPHQGSSFAIVTNPWWRKQERVRCFYSIIRHVLWRGRIFLVLRQTEFALKSK